MRLLGPRVRGPKGRRRRGPLTAARSDRRYLRRSGSTPQRSVASASAGGDQLPISPLGICFEMLAHVAIPAVLLRIGRIGAVAVAVPKYSEQNQFVRMVVGAQHVAGHEARHLAAAPLFPLIIDLLQLLLMAGLDAHPSNGAI